MADQQLPRSGARQFVINESRSRRLFGLWWIYLRGWLLIAAFLVLGFLIDVLARPFRMSRSMQMYRRMERKLARELRPDESRGYRIALVNSPVPGVKNLGVVTAPLREPGTGNELAAVYCPGTPDPTKGSLQVVTVDNLTLTDWTLKDILGFHLTLGSVQI